MSILPDRADPPENKVPCIVCSKEVPESAALHPESEEYVLYFCSINCYDRWRKEAEQTFGKDTPGE